MLAPHPRQSADFPAHQHGVSDNIDICLFPQKPIRSHFAFALERDKREAINKSIDEHSASSVLRVINRERGWRLRLL